MHRQIGVVAFLLLLSATPVSAQVLSPPALGGSASAFEQILGGANSASLGAQLHFQRCAGTEIDQFVVLAPNDQVWTIQRDSCQFGGRSAEERFAEAAQFLPADAVAVEAFTTEEGEVGWTYLSPSLGTILPTSLFHDCAGNAVAFGTLFVVADSYGGWFMGPGACLSG
jgi:hypothetical protein